MSRKSRRKNDRVNTGCAEYQQHALEEQMVRDCKVLLNNEAVTVVDFGGTKVQFPAIKNVAKTIKVKFANGEYSVVDCESDAEATAEDFTEPNDETTEDEIEHVEDAEEILLSDDE